MCLKLGGYRCLTCLTKYGDQAKKVLEALLDKYADEGMAHNGKAFVSGGHRCNLLTASCPPACTNAVLAAVFFSLIISNLENKSRIFLKLFANSK